eukprot:SAG31_NODE_46_length_30980_cov_226.095107_13_plen_119_part_00
MQYPREVLNPRPCGVIHGASAPMCHCMAASSRKVIQPQPWLISACLVYLQIEAYLPDLMCRVAYLLELGSHHVEATVHVVCRLQHVVWQTACPARVQPGYHIQYRFGVHTAQGCNKAQ